MIVCKIEMHPDGNPLFARPIGEVRIERDGGDQHVAHYIVQVKKAERPQNVWRAGRVSNFRRTLHGPYDLLLRGLVACVGGRSLAAAREIPDDKLLFDAPSQMNEVA